jgi:putative oxidoreductase
MTNAYPATAPIGSTPARIIAAMDRIPYWVIALAARVFPAAVFWQSGQTKVAGFHLKPSAIVLFQNEYRLPLIDPTIAAYASAISEHLFPILLVIGFATRFSALALLFMTAVIEIFVFPDAWPTHGVWSTCFLILIARGPGWLSLDHLIASRAGKSE